MRTVIGTCSLCGGDVVGHSGVWMATIPPPPARCSSCGATEARKPVIPMRHAPPPRPVRYFVQGAPASVTPVDAPTREPGIGPRWVS